MKKELQLIENDHASRMKEILDEAWKIFKWQFANNVFVKGIENEAPFQLHFASVIRSIGNMYVLPGETFYVDLETVWISPGNKENPADKAKKKYIDITCGFYELGDPDPKYTCAVELKFKRKDYGALPHNLFAIYKDIESLEAEVGPDKKNMYSIGRFYFITNNEDYCNKSAYVNKSRQQGDAADSKYKPFGLNEGKLVKDVVYHPEKGSDEDRHVSLDNDYEVSWEKHTNARDEDWYFLEIDVTK